MSRDVKQYVINAKDECDPGGAHRHNDAFS